MMCLHNNEPPVLHRDFHCGNILINKENTLKLIDFGYSKDLLILKVLHLKQT
jgi:thiamine kinase-like enzyme